MYLMWRKWKCLTPGPGWGSDVVGAGVARDQFAFLSSFVQIFDGENKYLERWTNTWYFNTCKNSLEIWNHENPKVGVNADGNEAMRHHKTYWFLGRGLVIFALKGKLSFRVAAFQLIQRSSSPNNSRDVQRRRDQGRGSLTLTLTMSPAWGSDEAGGTAAGQPGHQSAIGVWSQVNCRPQCPHSLSNSLSHFTESLDTQ